MYCICLMNFHKKLTLFKLLAKLVIVFLNLKNIQQFKSHELVFLNTTDRKLKKLSKKNSYSMLQYHVL